MIPSFEQCCDISDTEWSPSPPPDSSCIAVKGLHPRVSKQSVAALQSQHGRHTELPIDEVSVSCGALRLALSCGGRSDASITRLAPVSPRRARPREATSKASRAIKRRHRRQTGPTFLFLLLEYISQLRGERFEGAHTRGGTGRRLAIRFSISMAMAIFSSRALNERAHLTAPSMTPVPRQNKTLLSQRLPYLLFIPSWFVFGFFNNTSTVSPARRRQNVARPPLRGYDPGGLRRRRSRRRRCQQRGLHRALLCLSERRWQQDLRELRARHT